MFPTDDACKQTDDACKQTDDACEQSHDACRQTDEALLIFIPLMRPSQQENPSNVVIDKPIHSEHQTRYVAAPPQQQPDDKFPLPRQHNYRHPTPPKPEFINLRNAPSTSPFKRVTVNPPVTKPNKRRYVEGNMVKGHGKGKRSWQRTTLRTAATMGVGTGGGGLAGPGFWKLQCCGQWPNYMDKYVRTGISALYWTARWAIRLGTNRSHVHTAFSWATGRNSSKQRLFSYFRVGKNEFHHFCPP